MFSLDRDRDRRIQERFHAPTRRFSRNFRQVGKRYPLWAATAPSACTESSEFLSYFEPL